MSYNRDKHLAGMVPLSTINTCKDCGEPCSGRECATCSKANDKARYEEFVNQESEEE